MEDDYVFIRYKKILHGILIVLLFFMFISLGTYYFYLALFGFVFFLRNLINIEKIINSAKEEGISIIDFIKRRDKN